MYLLVIQQWCSLSIRVDDRGVSPEANLLAKDPWNSNEEGGKEENGHNCEGEDPLERNGLREELTDAKGCRQNAEREANCVILEGYKEEQAIDKNTPDCNICKYASR